MASNVNVFTQVRMEVFWNMISFYQEQEKELLQRFKREHVRIYGNIIPWTHLEMDQALFHQFIDQKKSEAVERSIEWQLVLYNFLIDRHYFLKKKLTEIGYQN